MLKRCAFKNFFKVSTDLAILISRGKSFQSLGAEATKYIPICIRRPPLRNTQHGLTSNYPIQDKITSKSFISLLQPKNHGNQLPISANHYPGLWSVILKKMVTAYKIAFKINTILPPPPWIFSLEMTTTNEPLLVNSGEIVRSF